jgi:hypothetical protein
MRKCLLLVTVLVSTALAVAAREGKDVKMSGYIIDNACGTKNANDPDKIKNHTKGCALMPPCVKSGYALYSDGKLYKLDKSGNSKVEALLKDSKKEKGIQVNVEGTLDGDVIQVKSLSEST